MHSTPGMRRLDRLAQRADEVGVPQQARAADGDRMHGEADDRGERRAVGAVDTDHRERVVDRASRAGRGCPTGPGVLPTARADRAPARAACAPRRRRRRAGRRAARRSARRRGCRAGRRWSSRATRLGALWLWLACTETASAGMPVSAPTRSRTAVASSTPAKTRSVATIAAVRSPSDSTSACATSGSFTPCASALPRGPARDRRPERRRDVDAATAGQRGSCAGRP